MIGNSETADDKIRAYYNKKVRELMFKPLKKEDMHYYKRPTASEIVEIFKESLTKEEYNDLKSKFTNE